MGVKSVFALKKVSRRNLLQNMALREVFGTYRNEVAED
jgi:hypothetical protein